MRYILLIIACLTLAAGLRAQAPVTAPTPDTPGVVDDIYLAKDDGNGKAGDPTESFFTTDIPIYCIVKLNSTKSTTVKMNFVAVAVTGVKPDSKVVTTSFTTKDGQNQVSFTGKPYDKWSVGKYRVDIFVDGKLAKDLVFDIRPASGSIEGAAYFNPKTGPKTRTPAQPKPH